MLVQHSPFLLEKINSSLNYYRNEYIFDLLPELVANYSEFSNKIPICYDNGLNEITARLFAGNYLKGCTFSMSSGTSNNFKLLAQRIWRLITPDSYPSQLVKMLIKNNVLNSEDVVANLFSAGGMSTLYDGFNRILEACKTTILPIGRLDSYQQKNLFLDYMLQTKANTLVGTPSSIIQCARLSKELNKESPIKKIIYTGEMFSRTKRLYVREIFPNVDIFGLYGQSETGFIGLNTPGCKPNHYHLLSDHFFIERTSAGEILVTDLTNPIVPLFRYYVGDLGDFISSDCACGSINPVLLLKGRSDKKFNFMGNLVSYSKIKQHVINAFGKDTDVQLQLSTNTKGVDILNIVIDTDELSIIKLQHNLENNLNSIEEIKEGIEKGTGVINISSNKDLVFSARQKTPYICDMRN